MKFIIGNIFKYQYIFGANLSHPDNKLHESFTKYSNVDKMHISFYTILIFTFSVSYKTTTIYCSDFIIDCTTIG